MLNPTLKLMFKLARFKFLMEEVGETWRWKENEVKQKKNKGGASVEWGENNEGVRRNFSSFEKHR